MSFGTIQRDRHGPVALLHLFRRRRRRRVIGDGRRHDDRVLPVVTLHHGGMHVRSAAHLHDGSPVGSRQVCRSAHQRHRGAAAQRLGGDGVSHPPARSVADKTNRIDVFERRSRGNQQAASGKRRRCLRLQQLLGRRDDLVGFGEPSLANPSARQVSGSRIDDVHAACDQGLEVLGDRGMIEHVRVHRRGNEHRRARRGVKRGQEIVGQAVRELADRIGRGRRDEQQIDVRGNRDVLDVGVRARLPLIGDHFAARNRLEASARRRTFRPTWS